MNKVSSGDLDAIVVARAGLARLGRLDDVTETLEPVQMLPAPAQGALAVECRAGDSRLVAVLAELDDADTRAAVTAERALLADLRQVAPHRWERSQKWSSPSMRTAVSSRSCRCAGAWRRWTDPT